MGWEWENILRWISAKTFFFFFLEITWSWTKTSQSDLRLMIIWVKFVQYCFKLQKSSPPFAKSWLRDWQETAKNWCDIWMPLPPLTMEDSQTSLYKASKQETWYCCIFKQNEVGVDYFTNQKKDILSFGKVLIAHDTCVYLTCWRTDA